MERVNFGKKMGMSDGDSSVIRVICTDMKHEFSQVILVESNGEESLFQVDDYGCEMEGRFQLKNI